jgi:hypothetical protein
MERGRREGKEWMIGNWDLGMMEKGGSPKNECMPLDAHQQQKQ